MNGNLNEGQIKILLVLEQENTIGYKELAEKANQSYDGVRGRISELNNLGFEIERFREGNKTMLKYKKNGKEIPSTYNKPSVKSPVLEKIKSRNTFCDIVDFLDKLKSLKGKKEVEKVMVDKGKKHALLIVSDLHFGEKIVDPISGKEVFNTKIAHKRMETLLEKTIQILKTENIKHLYIAALGDIIDGDMIYKNHLFRVDKPAIEQVQDGVTVLSNFIKTLLKHVNSVEMHCVRGNHGITNYNNLEEDNWDNVVYDMLNLVFADTKNVKILHYKTNEARINMGGRTYVILHGRCFGDQIKTAAGLKTFRGICAKHKLKDNDMVLIGDLHTFGVECDQSKFLIRNGSLADASEYAFKLQLYSEPEQTLLISNDSCIYPKILPIEVKSK